MYERTHKTRHSNYMGVNMNQTNKPMTAEELTFFFRNQGYVGMTLYNKVADALEQEELVEDGESCVVCE
jgi:hypothetical protein